MGNCPSGFTPVGLQCVVACPQEDSLENRMVGSESRCVYSGDATKYFVLKPGPSFMLKEGSPEPTMEWVKTNQPGHYPALKAAFDDYTSKRALLMATISQQLRIATAFRELQAAENTRGTNPQEYQNARNRYYTLTQGDTWTATERKRILDSEVLPEITPYIQSINFIGERQTQQAQTKTAVTAVKSKLMTLKDDFRTTTTTLMKQVDALRNQIELQKRRAVAEKAKTSEWFINVAIIVLSLLVIYLLYRRITGKKPAPAPSSSISKAYTSRAIGP